MSDGLILDDLVGPVPKSAFTDVREREGCLCVSTGPYKANNGDHIRSMSNAELARYLYIESNRMSETEWLEWLDRGVAE